MLHVEACRKKSDSALILESVAYQLKSWYVLLFVGIFLNVLNVLTLKEKLSYVHENSSTDGQIED